MKMGTRSLLYGAHCWFIHPWFVAAAWTRLYGFPFDPRLWVAFFVHDLGYWGLNKMDDERGEEHPEVGANIMHYLFDKKAKIGPGTVYLPDGTTVTNYFPIIFTSSKWYDFVYFHSRFLSKREGKPPSRLCYADKLAIALTPWWLYLPMVRLTGEIREYQRTPKHIEDIAFAFKGNTWHEDREWFRMLQARMKEFVYAETRKSTSQAGIGPSERLPGSESDKDPRQHISREGQS